MSHRYVANEDVLLIYYHTTYIFQSRKLEKFINIHLNKKNLEEEFNDSFSEAATTGVL